MREIKFRAWQKHLKQMFEVGAIQFREPSFVVKKGSSETWTLDEVELMQYTGLKDRSDKEIYEGDIILVYGEIRVVVFDHAWWMALNPEQFYEIYPGTLYLPAGFGMYTDEWFKPLYRYAKSTRSIEPEIIGNIYETPQLQEQP